MNETKYVAVDVRLGKKDLTLLGFAAIGVFCVGKEIANTIVKTTENITFKKWLSIVEAYTDEEIES